MVMASGVRHGVSAVSAVGRFRVFCALVGCTMVHPYIGCGMVMASGVRHGVSAVSAVGRFRVFCALVGCTMVHPYIGCGMVMALGVRHGVSAVSAVGRFGVFCALVGCTMVHPYIGCGMVMASGVRHGVSAVSAVGRFRVFCAPAGCTVVHPYIVGDMVMASGVRLCWAVRGVLCARRMHHGASLHCGGMVMALGIRPNVGTHHGVSAVSAVGRFGCFVRPSEAPWSIRCQQFYDKNYFFAVGVDGEMGGSVAISFFVGGGVGASKRTLGTCAVVCIFVSLSSVRRVVTCFLLTSVAIDRII